MESCSNVELLSKSFKDKQKEFKPYHLDELLAESIDRAFHKQTAQICLKNLAKIAEEYSPIDLAHAVSRLPSSLRPLLFENFTSLDRKVQFIIHTDSSTRVAIFRYISDDEAKSLFMESPTDEVVDMLEDLSDRRYRRILDMLEEQKAEQIRNLRQHCRESAGRLLTHEYFAFTSDMTIEEVSEIIKENPGIEFTRCFYILDEESKLLGFVPSRSLIVNPKSTPLSALLKPACHKVVTDTPREDVIEIMSRYQLKGLPVVDENNVLQGIIPSEDLIEVLEDIADETIASMAGTTEKVSEPESMLKKFMHRAPWLFVTLFAGLLNMSVMNMFQKVEGILLTFVFFFVPLVTGLSGNIGLQSSTILVRNMALGLFSPLARREVVFKELVLGLLTGAFFGVVSGGFVYLLNTQGIISITVDPLAIGVIVGVGLFGACIAGSILGVLSPVVFSRIGIDPAVASGPIVTAFNDFLSMSIYFLIAMGLSNILL